MFFVVNGDITLIFPSLNVNILKTYSIALEQSYFILDFIGFFYP
jgi:hypothetical protein